MRPYGVKGENGVAIAMDFASACFLSEGKYQGKTFTGSTLVSGRLVKASIAAENYDTAWTLFKALLKAERIRCVTQITIVPNQVQA